MKNFLFAIALMFISVTAFGASVALNIFGGQGNIASGGATAVQSSNSSVSAPIFGTAGGTHTSTAIDTGRATALINPQGAVVSHEQGSGTSSRGGNYSHGLSASGGGANGFAGGISGAQATFNTLGLGVVVLP